MKFLTVMDVWLNGRVVESKLKKKVSVSLPSLAKLFKNEVLNFSFCPMRPFGHDDRVLIALSGKNRLFKMVV